jgi:glycosyltransferase involved in cell wall biosynthesis
MNKILFVPCYDGHIRVFAPVLERLQEHSELEPLVVFLEQIHSKSLEIYSKEHDIPFINVNLFPYTLERNNKKIVSYFFHLMKLTYSYFYTKKIVKKLFDELKPAFVVSNTEVYYADRFFLREAKKRGIPSHSLFSVFPATKEGLMLLSKSKNKYKIRLLLYFIYKKVLTSLGIPLQGIPVPSKGDAIKVCVWSEYQKEVFKERGGIPEKLVITGSPMHDLIFQRSKENSDEIKNKVCKLLNINKNNEIILFASQPLFKDKLCTYEEQKRMTELVIEAVSNFDGYTLIIKLHPRESLEEYTYLDKHPLKNRFRVAEEKDADLYDLIQVSRLMITRSSTVGLDAMLFGKEVITINTAGSRDPWGYAESGAAIGVYNEEGLVPAINDALYNEAIRRKLAEGRRQFVYEYAYKQDGKASKRVVDLIIQMIEESGRRK